MKKKEVRELAVKIMGRWTDIKKVKYDIDRGCLLAGILSLLMIGLREVDFCKNLLKRYLFLFGGQNLVESAGYYYDTIWWEIFYWMLFGAMFLWAGENIGIRIFCFFKDRKLTADDDLQKRLFSYLDNANKTRKCFAILGDWGTGKTYKLDLALSRYRHYKFRPFYQISCFGLEDREDILDALKSECRHQDASTMQTLISWIQYLPALGPWLSSALEKKYELGDLAGNSVFIFEDFERIACGKNDKEEKYNLIVGFINEIVERYHYKAIIVCNHEEMDYLYNELLHKKLDCEEYKLPSQNEEAYEIARLEFENDNRLSKDEVSMLLMVVEQEIVSIIKIFNKANMKNLRKLVRVFRALAVYAKESDQGVTKKFVYHDRCILYSILYREILEESRVDLSDQYIKNHGNLFFDVYIGILGELGEGWNASLESLLCAPANLVFINFEPEKINSQTRIALDRVIETGREKAEYFSRWCSVDDIGNDIIKGYLYSTSYGLLSLVKAILYLLFHGLKDSELYRYTLKTFKSWKIEKMELDLPYGEILEYLYELRRDTNEIQKEYISVVNIFLSAAKPKLESLSQNGQILYKEMAEWGSDYVEYAFKS